MSDRDGLTEGVKVEDRLSMLMTRLRAVAQETPDEFVQRWPYNLKYEIESDEARLLLNYIEELNRGLG